MVRIWYGLLVFIAKSNISNHSRLQHLIPNTFKLENVKEFVLVNIFQHSLH